MLAEFAAVFIALGVLGGLPEGVEQLTVASEALLAPAARDWLVDAPEQEAVVCRSEDGRDLYLANGLILRRLRLTPNVATVRFNDLRTGQSLLRGVKPEARVSVDGVVHDVGGLRGQPNHAYLREEWIDQLEDAPGALRCVRVSSGEIEPWMDWARVRRHAPDVVWPPEGVHLRMDYAGPNGLAVSVHYALFDGVPVLGKWLTVRNGGAAPVTLDSFTCEILAAVEYGAVVEDRGTPIRTPNLHVETDFSFGGMSAFQTMQHSVFWVPDPDYATQVNYQLQNPCLLEVRPEVGPAETIPPGGGFASFRAYVMPLDSYERERNGLAQRRMYRTVAPWVTENPLMMHVRYADRKTVFSAIDQCADVGFEMVILTFGSGFNIEDDSGDYIEKMREYADYAREKGVEIGGYSLLASRHIDEANDVVSPPGAAPMFGNSPCLGSEWGRDYFVKLYRFYSKSGFSLLEHDGSYPGDVCISEAHPGHRGRDDSLWKQWRKITDFYAWCREQGVYLNVPDYYYLSGSNKCGMGYREVNWSLPRPMQVIHTRQNIYDGTWEKTPSMGWMFVPLTEYHGGGEAATIEPLDEHLAHYERMLVSNLALGVQACYRGPRLYDTPRTRDMVARWVGWYREYRDILESDLIHGRRADATGLDWMLHVNPRLERKGMLVVFNPLTDEVTQTITVPLYYAGLTERAEIRPEDGEGAVHEIARDYSVELECTVPAEGFRWYVVRRPEG